MDSNYSFEEVDFLLKRDWFLSTDDIDELLDVLDYEVFWEVFDNRRNYSIRIQDRFCHFEEYPPHNIQDITDKMMEEKWAAEEELYQQHRDDALKTFQSKPHPRTSLDERYEELNTKVQNNYTQIEQYNQRPRYYKDKIDALLIEIGSIQNEFESLKQRIDKRNKDWHELQWIESVTGVTESVT